MVPSQLVFAVDNTHPLKKSFNKLFTNKNNNYYIRNKNLDGDIQHFNRIKSHLFTPIFTELTIIHILTKHHVTHEAGQNILFNFICICNQLGEKKINTIIAMVVMTR